MIRFLTLGIIGLLFSSSSLFSILPPLYEGIKELKAVLDDPRLSERLHSGEVIIKIEKTPSGYLVTTNQHKLPVTVVYEKTGRIGPQQFSLIFEILEMKAN